MSATQQVTGRGVVIETNDGFPIRATRFDPPAPDVSVRVISVIANATGVQARFYKDFASWLAEHGVFVVTFDYRYSGLSFPPDVPGDPAAFSEEEYGEAIRRCPEDVTLVDTWAKQDLAAVIRYTAAQHPSLPLCMIGNSLGGHLMCLCGPETERVTRYLNLCGGCAYVGNTARPDRVHKFFKTIFIPQMEESRAFPATTMGLGFDLPYGPGKEWVAWFKHPHFAARRKEDSKEIRKIHDKPYLYIGFEDDTTITKKMMYQQLGLFSHADGLKRSLWIDPKKQDKLWPTCKHVNSLMKTYVPPAQPAPVTVPSITPDAPPSSSSPSEAAGVQSAPGPSNARPQKARREDTIWMVYLDWILEGHVARERGSFEHKRWKPIDERDLRSERRAHTEWLARDEKADAAGETIRVPRVHKPNPSTQWIKHTVPGAKRIMASL